MTLAAEPHRATLPLPGGDPRANVTVDVLRIARASAVSGLIESAPSGRGGLLGLARGAQRGERVAVPVVAFCLHHPTAGVVLVDTGLHGSVAIDPAAATGTLGGLIAEVEEMRADGAVPDQLRALGIDPGDVGTIVLTHLHADHAGGIGHFPSATLLVDRVEWQAAIDGGERAGYVKRQFDHAFDYRLLDFEGPDASSFSSFGHSLDLFGDGSIVLVSTPGHSAGHLSVIARLDDGREAFIAGDALPTMAALDSDTVPARVVDEHRFRRTVRETKLYLAQTPHAIVVPGHDAERLDALGARL